MSFSLTFAISGTPWSEQTICLVPAYAGCRAGSDLDHRGASSNLHRRSSRRVRDAGLDHRRRGCTRTRARCLRRRSGLAARWNGHTKLGTSCCWRGRCSGGVNTPRPVVILKGRLVWREPLAAMETSYPTPCARRSSNKRPTGTPWQARKSSAIVHSTQLISGLPSTTPETLGRPRLLLHGDNSHRPHQSIANARPLRPLPRPIADPPQITRLNMRRRDRLGGILHEYQHAA